MGLVGQEYHRAEMFHGQSLVTVNHCVKVSMTFGLLLNGGVGGELFVVVVAVVAGGDHDIYLLLKHQMV